MYLIRFKFVLVTCCISINTRLASCDFKVSVNMRVVRSRSTYAANLCLFSFHCYDDPEMDCIIDLINTLLGRNMIEWLTFFNDSFWLARQRWPGDLWIVIRDIYARDMINVFATVISSCIRRFWVVRLMSKWSRAIMKIGCRYWRS